MLLLLIEKQLSRGEFCQEAVDTVERVSFCPLSKKEWDSAAIKKNCNETAARQTCTKPELFVYHCVINGYGNETLEVCAPQRRMLGYCTEFNVAGGVIQSHKTAKCNTAFPKCDNIYLSSDAYKYPDCYTKKKTTSSTTTTIIITKTAPRNETKTDNSETRDTDVTMIVVVFVAVVFAMLIGVVITVILWKKYKPKGPKKTKKDEEQISLINKCGDNAKGNTEEALVLENVKAVPVVKKVEKLREGNKEESEKYLNDYRTMDKYFLETAIYKKAEEIFDKNNIVILTGQPGCGKTIAAIHMILKTINQKNIHWTFRKINSWDELQYVDDDEHALIFIDNIFFPRILDLENWWDELERIYKQYFAVSENETESNCVRMVMTARQNVLERACSVMGKVTPVLNEKFRIEASTLKEIEKEQIFDKQIEFAQKERYLTERLTIDAEFKRKLRESKGPIGFPLCANLYVCGKEYRKSGASFFSRPIEYLKLQIKDEIEGDKSNKTKTLFFCLFFDEWHTKMGDFESIEIQNESLCRKCLDKVSKYIILDFDQFDFRDLEDEALRLSGPFFKRIGENEYKFVHDSIYEAVGTYLCETYVTETVKYFPLHIFQHQYYERLTDKQMLTFTNRLLHEILNNQLSDVFSCKLFHNRPFVDCFCAELQKKDQKTIDRIFSIANKSSTVKFPCVFWSSHYNHTYLTELLYDIVNRREITPEYQRYVLLYGVCCAKNEGLLKTINEMLCDNLEMIQNSVLDFQDSEGNSILHLLVVSDFSDEFVSIAVEKLLTEKTSISSKNKLGITPLMFAVEQILPRAKVIKTILKFSKQLLKKDDNGSTILQHCLASNQNDKTCAEYLEIILEDSNIEDLVTKDNIKGDTALSTAAKCSKYSRIKSILLLLQNDANINTINYDGYFPLHLSVGCFKNAEASPIVELECCVRVILLILHGASPDKESDNKHKAVDECRYDLVRDILRNPKDIKIMENALETLLEKLNWTQNDTSPENALIHSEKMSMGIRKCISNAVHHLENIRIDQ